MSRRILVVESTWTVPDRGVVIAPGISAEQAQLLSVGSILLLRKPDGIDYNASIAGFYETTWDKVGLKSRTNNIVIGFDELTKDDIPAGTEVFLA